ncbi:MAG: polymerase sigma-70 factor [Chloroflexi bacterium]|nr:polymerase sigma-70 factor [Chloroflexota bacterium]
MLSWQPENSTALEDLVARYHTPIYRYLFRLTCLHALVEDLTQDCFERLVKSRSLYQYPRPFRPWLYAIATNGMRRHFESAYYRPTLLVEQVESPGVAAALDTPHHALELRLGRQEMLDVLAALTPAHRQVIVLRYVEGFALAEIAVIVQTPLGTVKTRIVRALDRLRTLLHQRGEPEETSHATA